MKSNFSRLSKILGSVVLVAALAGCTSQKGLGTLSVPVPAGPSVNQPVGGEQTGLRALGGQTLNQLLVSGEVLGAFSTEGARALDQIVNSGVSTKQGAQRATQAGDPAAQGDDSLTLSFPVELIGQQQVFGAIITGTTATQDTNLGDLKLTDLPPVHVITALVKDDNKNYFLSLQGCSANCTEGSEIDEVIRIPVQAISKDGKQVVLDLSNLGSQLDLMTMLDPDGDQTHLKTVSSKTVSLDYSLSTLVFDDQVTMVPVTDSASSKADAAGTSTQAAAQTVFTIRWYLKLASSFDPSFISRPAADGVGFFMTDRALNSVIERQHIPPAGDNSAGLIHYYVKNVPPEFQKAFAGCFDEWNEKFTALVGHNILEYEFIPAGDPRNALLVTGDPRYHIVEWDLTNLATYGGLGPSEANQFTGEIFTSNVLIQGPTIIGLYTDWFKTAQEAQSLMDQGRVVEANITLRDSARRASKLLGTQQSPRLALKLGEKLNLRVAAQRPELSDPLSDRNDFDLLPPKVDYATYMTGYFHDMLTHELGHNLGLRHNFKGSLQAAPGEPAQGKVTVSVMEYLGRDYRYLDQVGPYDIMAISYGYTGLTPDKKEGYCTDEDAPTTDDLTHSAECSPDDATNDSFEFFRARLERAVGLLVGAGTADAPVWKPDDMSAVLKTVITDMGFYAATADKTASTWTNFFTGGSRPSSPAGVKAYVLQTLKNELCGDAVTKALAEKSSDAVRTATQNNLASLHTTVSGLLAPLNLYTAQDLACSVATTPPKNSSGGGVLP